MKRDVLGMLSLGATFVVTASAEYHLARACGFGVYVAGAVPAALDIYALRALRAGRDMAAVVVAMAAVNALSHLVSAEVLPVSWPLIVAVSCIAPLVMWRVHVLREGVHGVEPPEPSAGPTEPEPVPVVAKGANGVRTPAAIGAPEYALERVPAAVDTPLPPPSTRYVGAFDKAPKSGAPSTGVEPPYSSPDQEGSGGSGGGECTPDEPAECTFDGAPEPEVQDEPAAVDEPEDELTEQARKEFADTLANGRTPSLRELKRVYSIGQDRAARIKQELGAVDRE
ncbi:hypothetical protein ACIO3O_19605 [Streptomyces sp. NPDC087440]|uniref:hypothetical protein n=1 Tax=Streptomyces sp. NPDC087440 TaxID=3365790 RepID=UPI00382D279C